MREIYLVNDKNTVFFVVIFEYRPHIVDAIKKIPNRRFDKETKAWFIKADKPVVDPLLRFINEFNFKIDDEAKSYIDKLKAPVNYDIKIPTLKGTLREFQKEGVAKAISFERCFIADDMGLGKAQSINSKILTPTGWKTFKNLKIGDEIINSNGTISHVKGIYPQGIKKIYKVLFTDNSSTLCCDDHLWNIQTASQRARNDKFNTKNLKEFKNDLFNLHGNRKNSKWFIPMVKPVQFKKQDVYINPYILGVLLGDGNITKYINFTSNDIEIVDQIRKLLPNDMKVNNKKTLYEYSIVINDNSHENKFKTYLKELNLLGTKSNTKFIPEIYKINTVENRISILQGLLDTDGYISKNGSIIEYYTVSKQLMEDVKFIVESLGGNAKIFQKIPSFKYNAEKKKGQLCYTIRIKLPNNIVPFRLKRKLEKIPNIRKYGPYRAFKSIHYVGRDETMCISVTSDDNLYVTDDFILTHNTIEAIAAVEYLDAYPSLIISPASLKLNWKKEINTWTNRTTFVVDGLLKNVLDDNNNIIVENCPSYNGDFVIINYDILGRVLNKKTDDEDNDYIYKTIDDEEVKSLIELSHKDLLKDIKFKSIIIDESQYCINRKSMRTQSVQELSKNIKYRFALSGTPMINRPSELISQLVILDQLENMGGFWTYAKRYCNAYEGDFGWNLSGFSNLQELHDKLVSTCFIRRRKKDVLTELPEKQRSLIPLQIDNKVEYDSVKNNLINWLMNTFSIKIKNDVMTDSTLSHLVDSQKKSLVLNRINKKILNAKKSETLVKIEYLKQLAAQGKLNKVMEFIDNFINSGEKLVLFATHKEIYNKIIEKYKDVCVYIVGGSSNVQKQQAVDKFQTDDKIKLFVGSIEAAGVGHTLTAASNVAFIELAWTSAMHDQCEDRCHRMGQKNFVNCYYLYGVDTIDELILELIDLKRKASSAVIDGEDVNITTDDLETLIYRFVS